MLASEPVRADPTAEEQYWLELINQARRDPSGELERLVNFSSPSTFGSPASDDPNVAASTAFYGTSAAALAAQWAALGSAPALAWSDSLRNSAMTYSSLMISMDRQAHDLDGLNPDTQLAQRMINGGYTTNYLSVAENLYASAQSTLHAHAGFMIDWGDDDTNAGNGFGTGIQTGFLDGNLVDAPHRLVTMNQNLKEVGIGDITSGIPPTNVDARGPLVVTQHFGSSFRQTSGQFFSDAILTGVVFHDTVLSNNFYTPGEGIAGQTVVVQDETNALLQFIGTTNSAGGFNVLLTGVGAGDVLRISVPGMGLPDQFVTTTGFVDTASYGLPVTFVNNPYAAFVTVPEPGSLLLGGLALLGLCNRRRTK